jgi:hypothetical protein
MENKRAHLEMLQGVINRMAGNSFSLKEWSVILVSALLALAAGGCNRAFVYLACVPIFAFWILDSYFLRQERLFRKLYDRVRQIDESAIDFSMDTSVVSAEVQSWARVSISKTLLIFHGAMLVSVLIVIAIMVIKGYIDGQPITQGVP